MKTWKQGIIGILAIIALALAFIACDDGNGKDDPEQPEYRETTITFTFLDFGGDPYATPGKANVKGTMLLADWNNAIATVNSRISSTQNNAVGLDKLPFTGAFIDDQNTATIIFDPNAGNGKYEVKDGEQWNLYLNPARLNDITDAELIAIARAIRDGTTAKG